jgi:hypothetical protein
MRTSTADLTMLWIDHLGLRLGFRLGGVSVHHACRIDKGSPRVDGDRNAECFSDFFTAGTVLYCRVGVYDDAAVALPRYRHSEGDQLARLRVQLPRLGPGTAQGPVPANGLGATPPHIRDSLQELLVIIIPIKDHLELTFVTRT